MLLQFNDKRKIGTVWLTNAEKDDAEIRESIKPFIEECKRKKYMCAIMESGKGDLEFFTGALLSHNKGLAAEAEKRREKELLEKSGRIPEKACEGDDEYNEYDEYDITARSR